MESQLRRGPRPGALRFLRSDSGGPAGPLSAVRFVARWITVEGIRDRGGMPMTVTGRDFVTGAAFAVCALGKPAL